MWVRSLGWEDPLETEMATHISILAWKIPWTEEPDGLQFMRWRRTGHDWASPHLSVYPPLTECYVFVRFHVTPCTVISISGKASLVMCTPSAFTSLAKSYFSFTSEGQFCQIQFPWLALFFYSRTLNTSPHSLSAYNVTAETPLRTLWELPCDNSLFSCCFQDSLCLGLVSFITMCFGPGLFWASWIWMSISCREFQKLHDLPPRSPPWHILVYLFACHKPPRLPTLFVILFPFCSWLDNFKWLVFKFWFFLLLG